MNTLLHIDSSIHPGRGHSSRLSTELVEALARQRPGLAVVRRALAADPLPHLDAARFAAFTTPAESRSPAQQAVVAESDALIDELRRADTIVLGLPLYNFDVPSMLKAWFDHIARAGATFRYTAQGPVGLLTGKKAFVVAARGGRYLGTALDTQTAYVRNFLAFLGIEDVTFVHAEGLAIDEASREAALAQARADIAAIVAPQTERIAA